MDFNYLIIGAGSAGIRLARLLGSAGKSVAIVEEKKLGGTCVHLGCVPKKLFFYASQISKFVSLSQSFGWSLNASFSWSDLQKNKNAELDRLNKIYRSLLESHKVNFFFGKASFLSDSSVECNGEVLRADKIIIATGSRSIKASFKGAENALYSDDLFSLKELPKKMFILGSGYIALEFASIFNGLGVDVSLICRGTRLLSGFDYSSGDFLLEKLKERGIKFCFSSEVERLEKKKDAFEVFLKKEKKGEKTDILLCAIGREANFAGLNLDVLDLDFDKKGFLIVDDFLSVDGKNLYAIGDIVSQASQLTPIALRHGEFLANFFLGKSREKFSFYRDPPTAIFTQPVFASVGFSEEYLKKHLPNKFDVYETLFKPMLYSLSSCRQQFYIKVLSAKESGILLGIHLVGDATEDLIQVLAVLLRIKATKADLDATLAVHPSSAEELVSLKRAKR